MGCDGGTIPKRHELVKGPKKVEKVDKDAELVALWNYCALSQEILRRPIVACELGRLYNKDAVIEFLLDKSSEKALAKAASHIKNIKHVTELRLSDNPAWEGDKGNTKGDKHDDLQRARFICPVVGLEMNGRHRFCFLRCCGCVFSERALKEIRAEVCHTCGAAFQEEDVIVLNGSKADVDTLRSRMQEKRMRARVGKKTKKPKAAEAVSHPAAGEASEGPSGMNMGKPEASSLDPREKKVGPAPRSAASGSSSGKAGKPPCGATKRSIAQSEESEAYKSLFTTHSSAKRSKEESAHWVTHTSYCF
ncbi:replication termination factor 2 isoform X2 [Pipistrellus kuhlii]|uniref:Replication termination factor 2 n=1 Tax=Pipistrellus kuhlii TaxID=59472 RepID=A0A7J7YAK8_PIPKU|nr:replication termination factor 2 isoform X2 [Pipistrellus kuhlii]KAF6358979.1 replication termination factor 2 [Pipistrellus kuhlii]